MATQRILGFLLLAATTYSPAWADEPDSQELNKVLQQYCVHCHGAQTEVEGNVDLVEFTKTTGASRDIDLLQRLIEVLQYQEMPPEDEPQPSQAELKACLSSLRTFLDQSVSHSVQFAQAPVRRMNRFQYNNAVTDLFELNCIVFTLPERMMREHKNYFRPASGTMADTVHVGCRPLGKSQMIEPRLAGVAPFPQDLRAEHGYDNRGDHLSLSPLLMESFLKLGQSVTHSPDFTAKRVGIWKQFFEPPPDDADFAQAIRNRLGPFLTRAFRQPAEAAWIERYASFAVHQINRGATFTEAMKAVSAAAISSPKFLYLYDRTAEQNQAMPLDELALASRLSFFLWGSIPDDRLLELATTRQLSDPLVLSGQVERMLRDKKLKRFCDSFPAQWLQLERIISSLPNRERFPEFYFAKYRNSMHMLMEPLLLFETVLIEDLPITQFIDSDFTYRSTRLQTAYGENVPAEQQKRGGEVTVLTFDRIPVTDRKQGGLITNAAVLTMTSGAERTQPITRGAWLATVVFNAPPDPPPADVPPLAEKPPAEEQQMTLKERLVQHRKRADCRGCHAQIDPLGFALENYNAIGGWREQYENGRAIDMEGKLFRKHHFANVAEFKDAILSEKERFAQGFAEHLLSFALARELTAADSVAVRKIVQTTALEDYRIQTLIKQLVLSQPFLSTSGPPEKLASHEPN